MMFNRGARGLAVAIVACLVLQLLHTNVASASGSVGRERVQREEGDASAKTGFFNKVTSYLRAQYGADRHQSILSRHGGDKDKHRGDDHGPDWNQPTWRQPTQRPVYKPEHQPTRRPAKAPHVHKQEPGHHPSWKPTLRPTT
ncbi:hypothetical protein B484DRAFT_434988, partial [Ochromonadaceae sp. CCMP2298]